MPRPLTRALAAAMAVLLVATGLLVAWHRASVRHGICAEHGDEIHLGKLAEHADHDDDGTRRLEESPWEVLDGEHHCQILAVSRDPVTAGGAEPADHTIDDAELAPALPVTPVRGVAIPLYRLAPKTSPPV